MVGETVSVVPSIWSSVNSWFTPAVFFVLLNLMIGTIAVTSGFASHPNPKQPSTKNPNNKDEDQEEEEESQSKTKRKPKLDRLPSVLQRLKSINLYAYRSPEAPVEISLPIPAAVKPSPTPPDAAATGKSGASEAGYAAPLRSREEPETEVGREEGEQSLEEVYRSIEERRRVIRVRSDTRPASGEAVAALPRTMKKSASVRSAFGHFEAAGTVEEGEGSVAAGERRRPASGREGRVGATEADDHEVDAKADDFINKFRRQLLLQRRDSIIRYKEFIKRGNGM